jgi:hypothetical protein
MKRILFLAFLMIATVGQAATLDTKEATRKLTDQAMAKVATSDMEGALLIIKPYLIVADSEFNVMLEQMKLQLPMLQGRFGKTVGVEFISEKAIGKSLLRIVQIQKFEKHIMRWNFIFYNPDGKWVLNTFYTEDKIGSLFAE